MTRVETFTFRVNRDERRMIEALAKRLQRSQSDSIRLIIREAAKELSTHSNRDTAGASNK